MTLFRVARGRIMMVFVVFPALIYILHVPFFYLGAIDSADIPKPSSQEHHQLTKPELKYPALSLQTSPELVKRKIIRERSRNNITDILIAKKMGALLKEMEQYRKLMKEAIDKAAEEETKAKKGKKIGNGLDAESIRKVKEQYEKDQVTNFYYTLGNEVVNPFNFKYILNNEAMCSQDKHALTYILYVHSAPGNHKLRSNIRRTWGQPSLFPQFPSRTVFFVGRVVEKDGKKQKLLEEESRKYNDIIQLDFVDAYHNLTYKGMGAMRWISEYCPNAKYIFKSDDDVYMNMPVFMQRLTTEFVNRTRFIMGHTFRFPSLHIQRPGKLCSKWCIPFDILPGLDHYPTFSSGSFYVYDQDMATELYDMATRTPFFWVDDVYLTGIIASRVDGLVHIDIKKMYRFNLQIYKQSLVNGTNPLTVTLTKDQVSMWKFHLPLIKGTWLNLLGKERQEQLIAEAKNMQ